MTGSEEERIQQFMKIAVALSLEGMRNNCGGPFGAIIVRNNEIVGRGYNQVTSTNDPTAHAEMVAIRDACKNLGTFELADCELFTSCEPCPMCFGGIYWARLKRVYYANTRNDAQGIGFDDSFIYEEVGRAPDGRKCPFVAVQCEDALQVFQEWRRKSDRRPY